jgi:hypothetical protein
MSKCKSQLFCFEPAHAVHAVRDLTKERQRHACRGCLASDWKRLKTNRALAPWQLAQLIGTLTRHYVCSMCVLELAVDDTPELKKPLFPPRPSKCKRHSVFNAQTRCTRHNAPWSVCDQCVHDVRTGAAFCRFCGAYRSSGQCLCPRNADALIDTVLRTVTGEPAPHFARLASDLIEYARQLQATLEANDTADARDAAVARIKATFAFSATDALAPVDVHRLPISADGRIAVHALVNEPRDA